MLDNQKHKFFPLFECRELDVRNRSWHRTPFRYVQVGSASIEWPPLFRVSTNGGESFPGLDGDTTRDFQAWRAGALGNRLSPQLMAQGQHAKSGGDAQICGTNNLQYYNVGLVTRNFVPAFYGAATQHVPLCTLILGRSDGWDWADL